MHLSQETTQKVDFLRVEVSKMVGGNLHHEIGCIAEGRRLLCLLLVRGRFSR